MKFINNIFKFFNNFINLIISAMIVFAIIIGGYAIYDACVLYNQSSQNSFEGLNLNNGEITFSQLKDINSDISGWIKIDDTNINYPVLYSGDNSVYLNKDYKNDFSAGGSIFIDYRNDKDFNDNYTLIYGHNMSGGLMFADIKKFFDKDFFNSHKMGKLYTENATYNIKIYAVSNVNAYDGCIYNIPTYRNGKNGEIINKINEICTYKNETGITDQDKLIALSTCDSAGSNDRDILFGKVEKLDKTENVIKVEDSNQNGSVNVEKAKKKHKHIYLTKRQKSLLILFIIVIIIFIIAIIQKIRMKKNENGDIKKKNLEKLNKLENLDKIKKEKQQEKSDKNKKVDKEKVKQKNEELENMQEKIRKLQEIQKKQNLDRKK